MSNPVRIYVLHHPASNLAASLTNHIYDWFRLPSLEGIPVYVRTMPAPGSDRPAPPAREAADASPKDKECIEYLLPLVDAHTVRDPVWHDYLAQMADFGEKGRTEAPGKWGVKMFPVALDSTAFNLPDKVTRLNFIRYGTSPAPTVANPDHPTPEEENARRDYRKLETEEMLKHLTEALARDLNARLYPEQKAERFKIFISYARADSTLEAKLLRNYIQSETQCLVFFDENDIGFGSAFADSLAENVGGHSRALLVINSDHYAERPWCRWEIDRFTQPRKLRLRADGDMNGPHVQVFHPLLVVDKMSGPKITRVVPELAQASVVRWTEGREKLIFTALMREVVVGLRDVLMAQTMTWEDLSRATVVNRLPGPMALSRIFPQMTSGETRPPFKVHHPGHGLPFTELQLLKRTFNNVLFEAFRDVLRLVPGAMRVGLMNPEPQLRGKVIAISTAHHDNDLATLGYLPQHQDEALIHLLRPLLRLGADLLYGGQPPKSNVADADNSGQMAKRNITLTLLRLLSDEHRVMDVAASTARCNSMLFNISSWPACLEITHQDEATWINACSIKRVMPTDAGLPDWGEKEIPAKGSKELPPGFRRHLALTMSHVRKLLADGFLSPVPGDLHRKVRPDAFVFMGGVLEDFKAVMPGVMEEFLRAAQADPPIPIYLMGGLGGATGVIARALCEKKSGPRPPELTQNHYLNTTGGDGYDQLVGELKADEATRVKAQFDDLWSLIEPLRGEGGLNNLFSNGLSDDENRRLLTTANTVDAVCLIWEGMSRIFLPQAPATIAPKTTRPSKTPPQRGKKRR